MPQRISASDSQQHLHRAIALQAHPQTTCVGAPKFRQREENKTDQCGYSLFIPSKQGVKETSTPMTLLLFMEIRGSRRTPWDAVEAVAPRSRLSRLSFDLSRLVIPKSTNWCQAEAERRTNTCTGFLFPPSVSCNPRGAKPLRNGRPANSDSFFGGAFPTLLLLSWGCQGLPRDRHVDTYTMFVLIPCQFLA